jgi:hypothetical protein
MSLASRRQVLQSLLGGSLLLPGVVSRLLADDERNRVSPDPLAPKAPHFVPKAKRLIFLYMSGAASHIDTFDPKPALYRDDGRKIPFQGTFAKSERALMKPAWGFSPRGRCGTEISDLFPELGECMDDICLIRSMKTDHGNHFEATLGIHTGSVSFSRPSFGSWLSYGLGTLNRNLPSYIVLAPQLPYAGTQVWSSDFLPGEHQGVRVVPGAEPIPNLVRRLPSRELQEMELGLVEAFNREHLRAGPGDPSLAARIKSFETAFGMQAEAPDAFDLSGESDATLRSYGLQRGQIAGFGWQCLVARRLAERGVRVIELIDRGSGGSGSNWDAHTNLGDYEGLARGIDRPIAGLIRDLKARGMLEDTLVVWTTEFGRTATTDPETADRGRGHHRYAFSSWVAGGGVKGGMTYGRTDEYGIEIVENEVHVHDFHATILHLLGLDHTRLTYRHAGRDYRLTDVHGRVVREILA